jgi:hypothetical protein
MFLTLLDKECIIPLLTETRNGSLKIWKIHAIMVHA